MIFTIFDSLHQIVLYVNAELSFRFRIQTILSVLQMCCIFVVYDNVTNQAQTSCKKVINAASGLQRARSQVKQ